MSKKRYAVFYEPSRSRPYSVATQFKTLWWWENIGAWSEDSEAEALACWRRLVQLETDERAPLGKQVTDWKP
jgi:hypothetical protein